MADGTGETIVSVPFQGHTINIACVEQQQHQIEKVGAKLWPTGLALSLYLVSVYGEDFFRGKSVIDLGSGVGLLGLALAKLGANVTFTDADESIAPGVLELLQTNVKANLPHSDINVCVVGGIDSIYRVIQAHALHLLLCFQAVLPSLATSRYPHNT